MLARVFLPSHAGLRLLARTLSTTSSRLSGASEPMPNIDGPRTLYKHLVRQTRKLPKEPAAFYKDSIRRGYTQHADEVDPERLKQIFSRAVEDAEWIVNKYSKKSSTP